MLGSAGTRGWTAALCLLALLPSACTESNTTMPEASESPSSGVSSTGPPLESRPPAPPSSSPPEITSLHPVTENSSGTTATMPEPAASTLATSEPTTVPAAGASSAHTQTPSTGTTASTPNSTETAQVTPWASISPGTTSLPPDNGTSPGVPFLDLKTSLSPATNAIKGETRCFRVKEVKASNSICLRMNQSTSCEDFQRDSGEALAQVLCAEEPRPCSWQLAQSEVIPNCLLLTANRTDLTGTLQVLNRHLSDLRKLGIHGLTEENVGSHQSHSRKTLIALVSAGLLLAALGLAGYFLMNRRSWSPSGERLGEDPYFTENGGGPGASPERQPKAAASHGAQENGQPPPRNGHSASHTVADTEL